MKRLAAMLVGVLCSGVNLAYAEAIPRVVIFHCDLRDGNRLQVTRSPMTDQFTLEYGRDISQPSVRVARLGNNMGTTVHSSSAEASEGREIYFTNGTSFYTVGSVEKGSAKEGYFQVTENTQEVIHQTCVSGTVQSSFDNPALFKTLTPVD